MAGGCPSVGSNTAATPTIVMVLFLVLRVARATTAAGRGRARLVLGRRPAIVSQDSVTIVLLLVLLYLASRSDDLRHWRPRQQHREPQITVMTNQVIIIMKFADTFTSSLVLRSMVAVADDLGCPGFWQLIAFEPRPCS